VRPLNWNEIIHKDDDNDNWADLGAPSSRRNLTNDGNNNDVSEDEEDMQGGEKGTGKGKGTKHGKGKDKGKPTQDGKGKVKGNGNGKVIVNKPLEDMISVVPLL
jgi:hypothetical protein